MAKLKIITGENNPILRTRSVEVDVEGRDFFAVQKNLLKKFAKDMVETMKAAKGLGIAAPQVGKNVRIFIATLGYKTPSKKIVAMVNLSILEHSADMKIDEEGCLSLPGIYGKVERFRKVKVEFFDLEGGKQTLELEGLDARVVQHELDHINGVLFIDRMKEAEQRAKLVI